MKAFPTALERASVVLSKISMDAAASPEWHVRLDDTSLLDAERHEVLELLRSAPTDLAAAYLVGVLISRLEPDISVMPRA
jgi:hypothetical protein